MLRPITKADVDWLVAVLAERRHALMPHAPTFWRPSATADAAHRRFLITLLDEPRAAVGFRTDNAALLATPGRDGWLVDDATVPSARWTDDPTAIRQRCAFARRAGLVRTETWWLLELPGEGGGEAGVTVSLPGVDAVTIAAPPVYDPPGPMLFLSRVTDPRAIAAAQQTAPRLGCAGIVVSQFADDDAALGEALIQARLRPHCENYDGTVAFLT